MYRSYAGVALKLIVNFVKKLKHVMIYRLITYLVVFNLLTFRGSVLSTVDYVKYCFASFGLLFCLHNRLDMDSTGAVQCKTY